MKYSGSKQRIAKYIVPILQKCIDNNNIKNYCEPFVGGANIIDKIRCAYKVGCDVNKYLIALLDGVKYDKPLLENIDREYYNEVKNNVDNYDNFIVGNVAFLASFNGKGFKGGYAKSGIEKTKYGERLRDYYREAKDNLLKQSKRDLFKDVRFQCLSYEKTFDVLNNKKNKWVIYLDPPYQDTLGYDVDNNFNHDEFWDRVRAISLKHFVFISEEQAPDDFKAIWEKETSRSLNPNSKTKKTEKLFIWNGGD